MRTGLLACAEKLTAMRPLLAVPVVFIGGLIAAANPSVLVPTPSAAGLTGIAREAAGRDVLFPWHCPWGWPRL